jgi:peptidoglycan/xylan/chitin deacetylase (PgdA/CDA1 family)
MVGESEIRLPQGWSRPHTVLLDSFHRQLDFLKSEGWTSVLPDEIDETGFAERKKRLVLTFDDGHDSDVVAAMLMKRCDYRGIFYVPWVHVDRRGFLNSTEIRELAREGFAIGSHGLTHSSFTQKSDRDLQDELAESRDRLEELLGRSVVDLAVPFGRYDQRVITMALAAGYRRIMTSDIGLARTGNSAVFPRLPVTARTTATDFQRLVAIGPLQATLLRLVSAASRRFETVGRGTFAHRESL